MASTLELSTAMLVFTLDLIGTFVFALSGRVTSGVKNRLDPFSSAWACWRSSRATRVA